MCWLNSLRNAQIASRTLYLGVSTKVFSNEISMESSLLSKDHPQQCRETSSNQLNRTKRQRIGEFLLFAWLGRAIFSCPPTSTLLVPGPLDSNQNSQQQPSDSQAFGLRLIPSASPVCRPSPKTRTFEWVLQPTQGSDYKGLNLYWLKMSEYDLCPNIGSSRTIQTQAGSLPKMQKVKIRRNISSFSLWERQSAVQVQASELPNKTKKSVTSEKRNNLELPQSMIYSVQFSAKNYYTCKGPGKCSPYMREKKKKVHQ